MASMPPYRRRNCRACSLANEGTGSRARAGLVGERANPARHADALHVVHADAHNPGGGEPFLGRYVSVLGQTVDPFELAPKRNWCSRSVASSPS